MCGEKNDVLVTQRKKLKHKYPDIIIRIAKTKKTWKRNTPSMRQDGCATEGREAVGYIMAIPHCPYIRIGEVPRYFFLGGGERQNKTIQIKENNIEKNRKQNRQTTTGLDATGNVATWSVALYVIVHHVLPYRGDSGVYSSATVATLPLGTTGNRKGK